MIIYKRDITLANGLQILVVIYLTVACAVLVIFPFALLIKCQGQGQGQGHVELDKTNNLYRTRVPGGWAYYLNDGSTLFVPEGSNK